MAFAKQMTDEVVAERKNKKITPSADGYTSSVSLTADSFSLAVKRPPFVCFADISPV